MYALLARGEKKARKAERAGQPPRAKSAYIFFGMGERAAVAADMPGASQATIMAELGRRWKVAGEEHRAQYVKMAEEDKARYAEEMAAFKKE
jgi:HMG (high mobility group) box